jgi:hypothetical protein
MPASVLVLEYGALITLLAGGYILRWYAAKDGKNNVPHTQGHPYLLERH